MVKFVIGLGRRVGEKAIRKTFAIGEIWTARDILELDFSGMVVSLAACSSGVIEPDVSDGISRIMRSPWSCAISFYAGRISLYAGQISFNAGTHTLKIGEIGR